MNVLAVMKEAAEDVVTGDVGLRLLTAAESVAELLAADKAFDYYTVQRIAADNLITSGDHSDAAYRKQASAHHAYDRAKARRADAFARCGGVQ